MITGTPDGSARRADVTVAFKPDYPDGEPAVRVRANSRFNGALVIEHGAARIDIPFEALDEFLVATDLVITSIQENR